MPRWSALLIPVFALAGQVALAQCQIEPGTDLNDGGWVGQESSARCVGRSDERYFARFTPVSGDAGAFAAVLPAEGVQLPLVHLARYSVQLEGFLEDGGREALTAPAFQVTADLVAPQVPATPVVTVDGGVVRVFVGPLTDDGQGGVQVESSFVLAGSQDSEVGSWGAAPTTLSWDLGPGTWTAEVQSLDVARNYGGRTSSASFVVAANGAVAPPRPPVPTEVVFTNSSISAQVLDPADAYHFLLIEADGGITSAGLFRHAPAAANSVAYGYLPRECRFRLMASRIVGGETSVWSAPSSEFWVDLQPPRTPAGLLLTQRDGGISVTWGAATDSCTGVGAYRVERLTAGAAVIISTSSATSVFDVPSSPGQVRYRVRAIDDAGWVSDSLLSPPLIWPPVMDAGVMDAGVMDAGGLDAGAMDAGAMDAGVMDAGVMDAGVMAAGPMDAGAMDAGAMDAGVMDAGAMDAGAMDAGAMDAGAMDAGAMDAGSVPTETTQLLVGCGCSSVDWSGAVAFLGLLSLALRRR